MTEYINITHEPGQDGEYYGPPGFQGLLYKWMRILAGGGTSEFSAIQMRGPLYLEDGSLVGAKRRFTMTYNGIPGSLTNYDFPGVPTYKPLVYTGGTGVYNEAGLVLPSVADRVGARNSTATNLPNALVTLTLTIECTDGTGEVVAQISNGGSYDGSFAPSITVAPGGVYQMSAQLLRKPLFANEDILCFLFSPNIITLQVPFVSFDIVEL